MIRLNQDALDAAADAMSEASYEANSGRDAAQRVVKAYLAALPARDTKKELDAEELEFWRQVIRGEAGYNGQPQALLGLLNVSDMQHLNRLRAAYPEAVAAVLESRS